MMATCALADVTLTNAQLVLALWTTNHIPRTRRHGSGGVEIIKGMPFLGLPEGNSRKLIKRSLGLGAQHRDVLRIGVLADPDRKNFARQSIGGVVHGSIPGLQRQPSVNR